MAQLGEEDRSLAYDGDDAFDDRCLGGLLARAKDGRCSETSEERVARTKHPLFLPLSGLAGRGLSRAPAARLQKDEGRIPVDAASIPSELF